MVEDEIFIFLFVPSIEELFLNATYSNQGLFIEIFKKN